MNSFLRRLKYYGFGFALGLLFVFFFFKNRGCSWLPENRVKNTLLSRVLVVSPEDDKVFKAHGWDDSMVVSFLNDGDIEFGKSNKAGNPQVYVLSKEVKGKEFQLWFTLPKDGFISEVKWPTGNVQKAKNSKSGISRMMHFPNEANLVYLADDSFFEKEYKALGIKDSKHVYKLLKKNGFVDFLKSNFNASPTPEQKIGFCINSSDTLTATGTWYKDRIQIFQFDK